MEQGDPFEGDDPRPFRLPPPPDDRLWRHPSELGAPAPAPARRSGWPLAVVSGLTGAALTVGLLTITGVLRAPAERHEVVVRETVTPASASVGPGPAPDVAGIVRSVEPAIVRLDVSGDDQSVGSGVLFRDDGHLITNAHVVERADRVVAVLASGRSVDAHVVATDTATDIAVVKLDADGPFPTAVLGTIEGVAVGRPAIAIGSPLGLGGGASVTVGVISALGREVTSGHGPTLLDMIQTDAVISAGSSGGALLDADGNLIGITTAYAAGEGGSGGLGFATPVDVARAVADDLLAVGHVRPVWLGVKGAANAAGDGVTVAGVTAKSPAADAGLRRGDVILRVGTRPVASMSALRMALRQRHPGDRIELVIDRSGAGHTVVATLAERPTG